MTHIAELVSDDNTVRVEYPEGSGTVYTIEKLDQNDPPVEILEALEDGKSVAVCRLILGDEQWAAFKRTKPKASDLNVLIGKALGTDVGKSDS